MLEPCVETLLFFEGHSAALPLYEAFETMLSQAFPDIHKRVQKTQITFFSRHVVACISFARVRRKADLPQGYLVVTLGLPVPLASDRIAVRVEARPNRWTHHIVISRPEDLDDELLSWIREAYAFAGRP